MKADQMQARSRHQSGQALHEFQRRHPEVRGAVTPGALQLQHDVTRRIFLEPLVGNRGAGDVAAQAFERLALMGATAHPGCSEVYYQMSEFYEPGAARGVRWNDKALAIRWPAGEPILSERDLSYPDIVA